MRDLMLLLIHLAATILRLVRPGGVRSVVAESVLLKHQLVILNRGRRRAPNLRVWDRLIVGLCSLLVKPTRLARTSIGLKPKTLLNFHRALVRRKYQLLFSPRQTIKPGPKGPDADVIRAVIEMKQRNRTWRNVQKLDSFSAALDQLIRVIGCADANASGSIFIPCGLCCWLAQSEAAASH
jgi:putative transposase